MIGETMSLPTKDGEKQPLRGIKAGIDIHNIPSLIAHTRYADMDLIDYREYNLPTVGPLHGVYLSYTHKPEPMGLSMDENPNYVRLQPQKAQTMEALKRCIDEIKSRDPRGVCDWKSTTFPLFDSHRQKSMDRAFLHSFEYQKREKKLLDNYNRTDLLKRFQ